jgi:uncharacterized protein (DUF2147 family)
MNQDAFLETTREVGQETDQTTDQKTNHWASIVSKGATAFGLMMLASLPALAQEGILGRWKTIDDETGKPKSIVEITRDGDTYKGKIAQLINPREPNPMCAECPGDKKGKPIDGLEIIWGIKETEAGKEWGGGKILDPQNGKVYKVRLRPKDGGEKLEVRGFIGFSLLGRSQTWLREK